VTVGACGPRPMSVLVCKDEREGNIINHVLVYKKKHNGNCSYSSLLLPMCWKATKRAYWSVSSDFIA
jgi:hypothetical protein